MTIILLLSFCFVISFCLKRILQKEIETRLKCHG